MTTLLLEVTQDRTEGETPFRQLGKLLFPPGYKLVIGTSQIYELVLAAAESRVLTREEAVTRSAYFESIGDIKTYHYRLCAVSPLQVDSTTSQRRKTFFQANLFKTGYATHGLFPYRGKFHPQMIKAVINIIGLRPGDTLLDPMMGSGTACLEASLLGVNAVGIDASPFCVLMAEGKQGGASAKSAELTSLEKSPRRILERFKKPPILKDASTKRGNRLGNGLDAFLQLCYLDAMGYAARRANKTLQQLFPIVLQRYVSAALNFASIRDELEMVIGLARYLQGDARDLSEFTDSSIDGIVTSPPYSFAIDYLANDKSQLEYLGVDSNKLRENMIGLRGDTLSQRVPRFMEDMTRVFAECARVLKPGKYAVFVIGTNSNQLKRALGTAGEDLQMDREFVKIAKKNKLKLVQDVIHPIEGIYNTLRDEHLLFFRK